MLIDRRSLLRGLFAAPAVVAAASLMPLRGLIMPVRWSDDEITFGHTWNLRDDRVIEKLTKYFDGRYHEQYLVDGSIVNRTTWMAVHRDNAWLAPWINETPSLTDRYLTHRLAQIEDPNIYWSRVTKYSP